ncbi:MAG TPA: plastocyanin/azurin family copper-binding protein [Catalimonadaceae bacterium]|nr:plastocyanin/azurin family copper-binding protein [Catalimonadaceae bacterium]
MVKMFCFQQIRMAVVLSLFFWFPDGIAQHHHHDHSMHTPKQGVQRKENQPKEGDFYKLITIGLPTDVILEGGGICTLPNGKLAVSTRRGEIWIVNSPYGLDGEFKPTFKRFARGLHEILGLKFRDGSFYVAQRGELTKITDTNGDGTADSYESITRLPTVGHYHEYSFGPVFDADGNMVVSLNVAFGDVDWYNAKSFAPWRGWIIKVQPDGKIIPWAAGVRSPCGIGIGPEGKVFYTENQGDWVGSGYLTVVEKGDFVANPASLNWSDLPESPVKARPTDIRNFEKPMFEVKKEIPSLRLPSIWLPHGVLGVSTSDFLLDSVRGRFGPFDGQYFVGDQGQSKIDRVFLEKVKGVYQGCAFGFRDGFASGVLRQTWGKDGSMFVAQTNRGWASSGSSPFAFQRVIWTGKTPFEMKEVSAMPDGFEIRFTLPVDSVTASDPASYAGSSFTYLYHQAYGSPVVREGKNPVRAVWLSPDKMRVRLVMDSLRQYFIHEIKAEGVLSAEGYQILHPVAYYTLNEIPDGPKLDLKNTMGLVLATKKTLVKPVVTEKVNPAPKAGKSTGIAAFKVPAALKHVARMPSSWSTGPDKTLTLGTTPGMRYDQTLLEVRPGQKVRLIFNNYDDMQHNIVIVKPGSMDKVGEAAARLGIAGNKLNYVPDMDQVLFHSAIIQPTSNESIYFEVPSFEGDYGFVCTMPGHYMVMRGILRVRK